MTESKAYVPVFGLTLSGGGFRAALFHLGVLARLAEFDLLRRVDMISTVSGGSIVGALYCLRLGNLLKSKPDAAITRDDYLKIVADMEVEFLRGVQRNLRVRILTNPISTLKMMWSFRYSRSDRLAELYERVFYGRTRIAPKGEPVAMTELPVPDPATQSTRLAAVPELFINATTLNTGRRFLFTAGWMGERRMDLTVDEQALADGADKNTILDSFAYPNAPIDRYKAFPVAVAVAASACVPALFPPLPLTDVYPPWLVLVVDGGVHDNQGLAILTDYECEHIFMSDASGQMRDEPVPDPFPLGVLGRTQSILMDRSRDVNVAEVRRRHGAVAHLRDGLPVEVKSPGPQAPRPSPTHTRFGVDVQVQRALAEMRTDLDAFSDLEADALMANGYLLTSAKLPETGELVTRLRAETARRQAAAAERSAGPAVDGSTTGIAASEHPWRFREILPELASPSPRLLRHLRAGSALLLKVPKTLGRGFDLARRVLAAIAVVLAGGWAWMHPSTLRLDANLASRTVLVIVGLLALGVFVAGARRFQMAIAKLVLGVFAVVLGLGLAWLHIWLANPVFLWLGRRRRGANGPSAPSS